MKKTVWRIAFIVALIVFIGSGFMLGRYFWQGREVTKDFQALKVNGGHDLVALHKQNPDIVGWITIDGTPIDYPVMQTPAEPEFYLRRNFKKEDSTAGTPFMDAACDLAAPTANYLIYGHNMKNGTMFHSLKEYENEDFYQEHPVLYYDRLSPDGTREIRGTYRIVAGFRSQIYPDSSSAFKYYEYPNITSQERYEEYVRGILSLSAIDTGITPEYGQQLVTLSTCEYHTKDGRFAVVAVLEHEE